MRKEVGPVPPISSSCYLLEYTSHPPEQGRQEEELTLTVLKLNLNLVNTFDWYP